MIDVIVRFASEAAALAALAAHTRAGKWADDHVISGVQVWLNSANVPGAVDPVFGAGPPVHAYLPGFFVAVSVPVVPPALLALSQVQFAFDRDMANARQAGCVLKSAMAPAVLQDMRFSPVFAGSDPPFGGWPAAA